MTGIYTFIKKTAVFILSISIFLAPGLIILNISGELLPLNRVVAFQEKNKNSLFGVIYTNPDVEYKLMNTFVKKPKILVLGSSRVMQFRSFFFQDSFYNAGGSASRIEHFEIFLKKLIENDYAPDILIVGLDQVFFNPHAKYSANDNYQTRINNLNYPNALNLTKPVYQDLLAGKLNLWKLQNKNNHIGINAIQNNNGFTYDGSYYYGKIYSQNKKTRDYTFKDIKNRINQERSPFEYGREVNLKSLSKLESLFKTTRAHHIKVVAFLPPFSPIIYQTMEKSKNYEYLSRLPKLIERIAADYQVEFFDFTYLPETTNQEYVDGFHGSDIIYLKILSRMAKNNGILSSVVNQNDLSRMEKNKISDLLIR